MECPNNGNELNPKGNGVNGNGKSRGRGRGVRGNCGRKSGRGGRGRGGRGWRGRNYNKTKGEEHGRGGGRSGRGGRNLSGRGRTAQHQIAFSNQYSQNHHTTYPQCQYPANYRMNQQISGEDSHAYSQRQQQKSYKPRKPREFDPFKAQAISMAKAAQDMETVIFASYQGPFYSMDIECVACGYGHSNKQRYPCRVSLVMDTTTKDSSEHIQDKHTGDNEPNEGDNIEIVLDEIVNLNHIDVASYMTPLTGMTAVQCLDPTKTKSLDEIRNLVKFNLPKDCTLVGHSIKHDIDWLGLEVGVDFKSYIDTSSMFRQRIPKNLGSASNVLRSQANPSQHSDESDNENSSHTTSIDYSTARTSYSNSSIVATEEESNSVTSRIIAIKAKSDDYDQPDDTNVPFPTKYRLFSLRHCCIHLLYTDIQENAHNPVIDAKYSLLLFRKYQFASPQYFRALRDSLHRAPTTPSFAMENPIIDGVVLSYAGYRLKWAGRFIWKWWLERKN